ncbi:MAG TPA: SWIM zinc finger family protein, partial [Candidatus Dormibacteraeota bacterium]|nr:SWIM zinc finger family protein [Candidatus Dormibacteraeota bacterium]
MAGSTRARRATTDVLADLTFERLSSLADARTIARGAAYATSGRVRNLRIAATSIVADVRGTARYRVRLGHDGGVPTGSCTCPVGTDGLFCKHCVAVAIVATDGAAAAGSVDLPAHVGALDHDRLVALVLELADNDDLLRARLELEAARTAGTGDARLRERFRRAIDDALVPRDYVSYHDVYDYTTTAQTLVETLSGLITDGSADIAIDLTEHAMTVLENAVGYIDDSDGHLRGLAEDIQAVHRAACFAAEVDPVELAGRLFELEMAGAELEAFYGAVSTYSDLLGDAGLAEYRRRATVAWSGMPALAPGDDGAERSNRFRLTQVMETLAKLSGDVDAQVEVMAHDLSASWQFVRIGTLLVEHDRRPDALAWAERGLAAFGARDHRLIELLFDLYHQLGRGGEAVALARRLHDEDPGPASYRDLAAQARRARAWNA